MASRGFGLTTLCFALLLPACKDDDPTRPNADSFSVEIDMDSALLLVGDTVQLSAQVRDPAGQLVPEAVISWSAANPAVAEVLGNGRVFARGSGTTWIVATGQSATDSAVLRVVQLRGCEESGVNHRGVLGNETWKAGDSPHHVSDTLTVSGQLTIEAGAIVCAAPGASFRVLGGAVRAIGTAHRRVRFLAMDTVVGWRGITAGGTGLQPGGTIVLTYADVKYAALVFAGFQSSGDVANSYFRRTTVGSGTNFSSFSIRNSVVEDALVQLTSGRFEETTIRRGRLELIYSQGSGSVTLNGGRIEESPGFALTIGSTFSNRVPGVNVVKAPVIMDSRGGIAMMPPENFFGLWPTAQAQTPLLNNINRRVYLWGSSYPDLHLRAGLDWYLAGVTGSPQVQSLTVDPGATITLAAYLQIVGPVQANGTAANPISIRSFAGCLGARVGCGLTLKGAAASRLFHVNLRDASIAASERNTTELENITSNYFVNLAAPGSRISDSEIADVADNYFPPAGALTIAADSITVDRVVVHRTVSGPTVAAIAINGSRVRILSCDLRDNLGDAIRVRAGSDVEVHDCNLERNGNLGVNNQTAVTVKARRNWWGDPGGPLGPLGDGVSAGVDFSDFLQSRR